MGINMTIELCGALKERYERYAAVTNQSLEQAAEEALDDWMSTCGEGRVEVITGIPMSLGEDQEPGASVSCALLN